MNQHFSFTNRPPITIVIPFYNRSVFIQDTLTSVMSEVSKADEIIIVNDGSSKDELKKLESVLENVPLHDLRLISHASNRGGGAARNTGVRNSKYEWIFNLDSDNLMSAGLLDSLVHSAQENGLDVASPQSLWFFRENTTKVTHKWEFVVRPITLTDHLVSPYVPSASGNYLFNVHSFNKVGGFPEYARALDSWGFGLRLVSSGALMQAVPGTFYFHRFGHESYYIRSSKDSELLNLHATSLVLEYAHLLDPYVLKRLLRSRKRGDWFSKVNQNPFRINSQPSGKKL